MTADPVRATVIMPCRGQLELTRLAVPRLLRHAGAAADLHFIDLGSLDGTAAYLAGVAAAALLPVRITTCADEADFPALFAQAIAAAEGAVIALLSNETLLTAGWIEDLARLLGEERTIGLAGPVVSHGPAGQRTGEDPLRFDPLGSGAAPRHPAVRGVPGEPPGLDEFAALWRQAHAGLSTRLDGLAEHCLVLRRDVAARLGPWPPLTSIGAGQRALTHLSMPAVAARVSAAGLTLACARSVFVYDFGTRRAL